MMYVMLCGHPPFDGQTEPEVLAKVVKGSFVFEMEAWANVSQEAKELTSGLIVVKPHERYTAGQALAHTCIKARAPKATDFAVHDNFIDHLRSFGTASNLKKAALRIIASEMSEKDARWPRDMFRALDSDGNGLITMEELQDGVRLAGITEFPPDFADIVLSIGSERSGIDYTEFMAASLKKDQYLKETACRKAFCVFDRDRDGRISVNELMQVLNSGSLKDEVSFPTVEELMKEFGLKKNGQLDFEEFKLMMLQRCSPRPEDFQL